MLENVMFAQIKKLKKKSICFLILFLGGPSPPTKMYMKAEMLENVKDDPVY